MRFTMYVYVLCFLSNCAATDFKGDPNGENGNAAPGSQNTAKNPPQTKTPDQSKVGDPKTSAAPLPNPSQPSGTCTLADDSVGSIYACLKDAVAAIDAATEQSADKFSSDKLIQVTSHVVSMHGYIDDMNPAQFANPNDAMRTTLFTKLTSLSVQFSGYKITLAASGVSDLTLINSLVAKVDAAESYRAKLLGKLPAII